jgi:HEAT repeat protein
MRQRLRNQDCSMHVKLPRPRVRLRTLTILIAALAVTLWAGLNIWSPTRRFGRLLRADQPVFVRREAASSLGRDIPSWEVDRAVSLLISALDDPSSRVREYAGVGLAELGPRAEQAASKLIAVLNDEDRFVRFSAARTLGFIIDAGSAKRTEAVAALTVTLEDKDPEVRLAAAETLVKMGEAQKAAKILLAAYTGTDSYLRDRARPIIRGTNDPRPFVAMLVKQMRDKDRRRRDEAFQTLLLIASPEAVRSALNSALADDYPEIHQWAFARIKRLNSNP